MSESAALSEKQTGRTLLLGIDTSSEGELALAQLNADHKLELLASQQFSGRQQSVELISRLTSLLTTANATMADIRAIIVVSGPGSFTGLRIGLSAAKGLAEAANIPLIAISSLAVLAGPAKNTVPVMMAGRAEYYVRLPSSEKTEPIEALESEACLQARITDQAVIFAGNLASEAMDNTTLQEKFPAAKTVTLGKIGAYPAMLAALPRYLAAEFDDVATLDANYVRRPYTEPAADAKPVA